MTYMLLRASLATTFSLSTSTSTTSIPKATRRMKAAYTRVLQKNFCERAFRPPPHFPALTIGFRLCWTSNSTPLLRPHQAAAGFSTTPRSNMSDADYAAFLEKANQDVNEGYAKSAAATNGKLEFKAQDKGAELPKAIQEVLRKDKVYISDADEPFVGVALEWDEGGKGLPDEVEFAQLIQHPDPENAGVDLQDPVDWDSSGDYQDIIEAVRKAGKGNDVRVYRVPKGGVRTEYWLVTTEGKGKGARLVGVKALSIES